MSAKCINVNTSIHYSDKLIMSHQLAKLETAINDLVNHNSRNMMKESFFLSL